MWLHILHVDFKLDHLLMNTVIEVTNMNKKEIERNKSSIADLRQISFVLYK